MSQVPIYCTALHISIVSKKHWQTGLKGDCMYTIVFSLTHEFVLSVLI